MIPSLDTFMTRLETGIARKTALVEGTLARFSRRLDDRLDAALRDRGGVE